VTRDCLSVLNPPSPHLSRIAQSYPQSHFYVRMGVLVELQAALDSLPGGAAGADHKRRLAHLDARMGARTGAGGGPPPPSLALPVVPQGEGRLLLFRGSLFP
jgi:hypothetical protein